MLFSANRFSIEATTGDVSVIREFNFESPNQPKEFVVTVHARNSLADVNSDLVAEVLVAIKLVDVNDNAPVFDSDTTSSPVVLYWDTLVGTKLFRVHATDADQVIK